MVHKNGLFIFRRDLRIQDNIGLYEASKQCQNLYLTFYFTPEQVLKNSYKSNNAIQFMIESLEELEQDIRQYGGELIILLENHQKVIPMLHKKLELDAVFFNKDVSPYSAFRDNLIIEYCKKQNIVCESFQDYYLYDLANIQTTTKKAFQKYTPFYNQVLHHTVSKPSRKSLKNIIKPKIKLTYEYNLLKARRTLITENPEILVHGGRINGLKRLKKALGNQREYDVKRNYLHYDTSFLSSYIKFGCISVREVYHSVKAKYGIKHGMISELIWREFFAHVLYHYPEVLRGSYYYKNVQWRKSNSDFKKWCKGKTGFPVVGAGMRQMNATGFMHNRSRMMAATLLIKVLLLDWRLGERYFAQMLTDYDPASNNGNWQAISGTGVDMKPYFRTMSPWIQTKKFDPECIYLKRWIPELKDVPPKDIHTWNESWKNYPGVYIEPIADFTERTQEMMKMYKKAGSR